MKIPRQLFVPKRQLNLMVNSQYESEFKKFEFTPGNWMIRVALSTTGDIMFVRPLFCGDDIGITGDSATPYTLLSKGIGLVPRFTDHTGYFNALLKVTENKDDACLICVPSDETLLNRNCSYLAQARIKNSFLPLASQLGDNWQEGARCEVVVELNRQRIISLRYRGGEQGGDWQAGCVLEDNGDTLILTALTRDGGVDFGGIIV